MKTIAFVNMKGGVGKTTLAVNVAHFLAKREAKQVLLVDLDPQFNATQCLVSPEDYPAMLKKGAYTVYDIFDDNPPSGISLVSGTQRAKANKLASVRPSVLKLLGFDILLGNLSLYQLDMGGATGRENRLKRYLEQDHICKKYDIVLIDSPPTPSAWMTSSLLASDYYLVPVKPEPLSHVGIDLLKGVINRCTDNHGHKIECLGLVVTMADERTTVFRETLEKINNDKEWKTKRFDQHLPKRINIARDQGSQTLILNSKIGDAKTAMSKIVAEFLARLGVDNG